MNESIFIAVLAGLGAMFGWGLADFFAKKTIDKVGDIQTLGLSNIFGTIALFALFLFQVSQVGISTLLPTEPVQWLGLMFFGALQGAIYLFVYKGFGKGNVSLLSPVFATFGGFAALISILYFKEVVSGYVLLSLLVIFIGILIINSDRDTFRFSRKLLSIVPGFKEVGTATLMAAFWLVYWDQFVGGENWLAFTFYMYGFMTIYIFLFAHSRKISMQVQDSKMWKFLAFIGFGEILAYGALSWGYSLTTHTSIITVLAGASALPTIVLAAIFLKERITKIQLAGVLITIIGVMLISFFNI